MHAILLAAGRSERLKPLSDKNFLLFCGKPLLQHQIESLQKAGIKNITVIGGAHNLEKIQVLLKNLPHKKTLSVCEQKDLDLGMGGAVLAVEKERKKDEPLMVVSGNDVLEQTAYTQMARQKGSALLVYKVKTYFPGGYVKMKGKTVTHIIEKPTPGTEPSDLVNIVVHVHHNPKQLFDALKKVKTTKDDRYESALQLLFEKGVQYTAVPYIGFWQPIKYPWHVYNVAQYLFAQEYKKRSRKIAQSASIAQSAKIHGDVIIEDGVKIFDNAVVQGPAYIGKESVIATNALVRSSFLGERCVAGYNTEVARSYCGNDVWTHSNYIGDSIIGNNCSFGAGAITGNLRLDEKNIPVMVNGKRVDSGTQKLGLIAGDGLRCGVNTSFMPGIRVGKNVFVGGGIVVPQDIPDNQFVYGTWTLTTKPNTYIVQEKGDRGALMKKLRKR